MNLDVAREADIAFVAVPYEGQRGTLEALVEPLADKIVVEVVAPLSFGKGGASAIRVPEG